MKSIPSSIRVAAAAIAAVAAMAVPALSHAGSVTVNSAQVCTDAPTLSMTPAGDLQITCTVVATGGASTVPGAPALPAGTLGGGFTVGETVIAIAYLMDKIAYLLKIAAFLIGKLAALVGKVTALLGKVGQLLRAGTAFLRSLRALFRSESRRSIKKRKANASQGQGRKPQHSPTGSAQISAI